MQKNHLEQAQTMAEYAVVLAVITIMCIAALSIFSQGDDTDRYIKVTSAELAEVQDVLYLTSPHKDRSEAPELYKPKSKKDQKLVRALDKGKLKIVYCRYGDEVVSDCQKKKPKKKD